MWPFDSSPRQRGHIEALKDCHCGERSYGPLRALDAVHCNYCGATYFIGSRLVDPVARIVWEPEDGEKIK